MSKTVHKILMIDDNAKDRVTFRDSLEQNKDCRYEFLEEESGHQGIKTCLAARPDCILLNYNLPDCDGVAALKEINPDPLNPDFPVVLLSGSGSEVIAVNALQNGAQDYLVKGKITPEDLRLSISKAMEVVRLQKERRQTLENLRVSELRLQLGTEVANFAICEIDYTNNTNHLSLAAAKLFGLGDEEMTVTRAAVHATFHPEDADELAQNIAASLNPDGDGWFAREHRIVLKNGEVRWLNVRKQIFFDRTAVPPRAVRGILAARDITERKQAEASRAQLAAIVESAADAIYVYDFDGTILNWNRSAEALYGYTAAEIVGQQITTLMPPELVHQPEDLIAAIKTGEPVVSLETRRRRKDGTQFAALLTASPIKDAAGRYHAVSVIAQDITARKKAQDELRESEERMRLATEATMVGIWEWNVITDQIRWDAQMFRIYGIAPTQDGIVPYSAWSESVLPEELPRQEALLQETMRRHGRGNREFRIRRRDDGAVRYIHAVETVRANAAGQVEWVVGTNLDITERKKAESESYKLVSIVESSDDAIISKDFNGTILSWNNAAERIFGFTAAEAIGQNISILFPPERLAEENEVIATIKRGEKISHYETVRKRKDGTLFPVSLTVSPVKNTAGEIVGISKIARDITKLKKAQEELRTSEEFSRTVLERSPDCVKLLDREGRLEYMNANGTCLLEIDDFVPFKNKFWWDLWTKETQPIVKDSVAKALRGETTQFQAFTPTAKGTPKWWDVVVAPISGKDGKPERIISVSRDITEGKRAEEQIRESAEQLRRVLDNLFAFVGILLPDGTLTDANRAPLEAAGIALSDVVGKKFWDCYWWNFSAATQAQLRAAVERAAQGEISRYDVQVRMAGGVMVWIDFQLAPLRDSTGRISHLIPSGMVIDERKQAETQLRESEGRFRRVLAQSNAGIVQTDAAGRMTLVNQRWCEMLGYSEAELLSMNVLDVTHSSSQQITLDNVGKLAAGGPDFEVEKNYQRKDGSIMPAVSNVSALRGKDGEYQGLVAVVIDMTERLQAEAEIKALSDYNRHVLESITDPLFTLDRDWRFTYISETGEKVLFRQPGELLGKSMWEEFPGVIGSPFEKVYRRAMDDGITGTITDFYPDHDRWYEAMMFPAPTGITVYFRDLSDRKRRELNLSFLAELSKDFTPLSSAAEIMQMAGVRIAEHLKLAHCAFVEINESADEAVVLYDHHEAGTQSLVGHYSLTEFLDEESERLQLAAGNTIAVNDVRDEPRSPEAAARFEALGIGAFLNAPYLSDGRWKFALSVHHSRPYQWRADEIELLQELAARIYLRLERARAEESLRESEERFRALFDSIDEGFCIVEMIFDADEKPLDYRFIQANPAFSHLTGLPASAIGQTARELVPDLEEFWFETYGKVALTGEAVRFENKSEPMNRWFEVFASRIGDEASRRVAIVFNNITERKQSEAERERLLAQEQAARAIAEAATRAKDEFLALVTHELRNPLNAILGYTRINRMNPHAAAQVARNSEIVERSARMQQQLIDDLLDTARIVSGKLKIEAAPTDLRLVLEDALSVVRPAAEARQIELAARFSDDPQEVIGDAARLQQVALNLLQNAIKFTPESGRVELRVERADHHIRLIVSDTGKGIEPDFLPYIFDRFSQTDTSSTRRHGGLGLGLALAKRLVELHGGTIAATSAGRDMGSTFTVSLPLRPPQLASSLQNVRALTEINDEAHRRELARLPRLTGVRVLVVDDQEEARMLVAATLEERGAQVTTAASGTEAVRLVEQTPFDVLVCDISMPEVDGYEVLRRIRAHEIQRGLKLAQCLPAVALTALSRSEDRLRALGAGFQMHTAKPVEPVELIVVIASLIGSR